MSREPRRSSGSIAVEGVSLMNARNALPALALLSVLVGAVALAGGLAAGTATA
jgi:hypothetical protein